MYTNLNQHQLKPMYRVLKKKKMLKHILNLLDLRAGLNCHQISPVCCPVRPSNHRNYHCNQS